jgi:hypothetical protein
MERVKKIVYREKEIISVDYSDCKETEMMVLLTNAKDIILAENKNVLIYSAFNSKNYITPTFMRHLEKELKEGERFIQKSAIIGLSKTQLWILKGINLWFKKKIYHFETRGQALDFLVDSN